MMDTGIELVPRRIVVDGRTDIRFALRPGDRALVGAGDTVVPGTRVVERVRDTRLVEIPTAAVDAELRPGDRWARPVPEGSQIRRTAGPSAGELLFEAGGRWRLASGEHVEHIETPVAGVIRDVRLGIGVTLQAEGRMLRGVEVLGDPTRGVLAGAGIERGGEAGPGLVLRQGSLDVGLAGSILVVGSRIEAETLTRARAMGLRGVIVAGLAGKERRDFMASESRQRAALHRLPTFAVLILDGAFRRPIASPIAAVLQALAGREVAIVGDPPGLVFNEPKVVFDPPAPDLVRVRGGEHAGR
jgi:hypothetical protein